MNTRIGFACIDLDQPETFRTCRKSTWLNGGVAKVGELALHNLQLLEKILTNCQRNGIRLYRMSSTMIPWWDGWRLEDAPQWNEIDQTIQRCAALIEQSGIRCTFHPGHFCVPASANPKVVETSIKELELHADLMDRLRLPRTHWSKINIHMATSKPNQAAVAERFKAAWNRMSDGVRSRLTLENDDSPGGWAVEDLLPLCKELGIPVVFDSLHWKCYQGKLSYREALGAAVSTWPQGIPPIVHHSSSRSDEMKGAIASAHSDWILERFESNGMEVDIMLEAKMKNRAVASYIEKFGN